jgi:hypothetical protein
MFLLIIPIAVAAIMPSAYFAFSKKSSPVLKRTAFIALILVVLSGAACLAIIVLGPAAAVGKGGPAITAVPVEKTGPSADILIIGVVFLISIGIIIFLAVRETLRSRNRDKEKLKI